MEAKPLTDEEIKEFRAALNDATKVGFVKTREFLLCLLATIAARDAEIKRLKAIINRMGGDVDEISPVGTEMRITER